MNESGTSQSSSAAISIAFEGDGALTTLDFARIRSAPKSRNDSFEALAVQLFRSSCSAPAGSTFVSLRGDGGDGGVEAYYRTPVGKVLGVQAKYFFKLDAAELEQIAGSLKTALVNHPTLSQYWVYIPFDLTGRTTGGKRGVSQAERFEAWKKEVETQAKKRGTPLTITLCTAAVIRTQLLDVDPHGGRRRYWFDDSVLTEARIKRSIDEAVAFAGPRYTGALDVATDAHDGLDFFGGTGDFAAWREESLLPVMSSIQSLRGWGDDALDILGDKDAATARKLIERLLTTAGGVSDVSTAATAVTTLNDALAELVPLFARTREAQETAFYDKYGREKDTPSFRQFHAEYMCNFPAGKMDAARDWERAARRLESVLASGEIGAALTNSLLLVGPAGIGKTHAIVSAAIRRLKVGGFSLVVFGDDFGKAEPWEVLRTKLGFGAGVDQEALLECLQACADHSDLPFVIYIDALNESPREARWKKKLPELLVQCKPYPGIRVCVSTRDTYRDLVVDSRFPGFAFEHAGFAGQEFEAVQAFAAHYGLDAEITPLFSPELSNPLFLHLACRTLKDEGRNSLDVSLPGFTALFEGHLKHCDGLVRERLGYANPRNLVRAAMLRLADTLTQNLPQQRTWEACTAALHGLTGTNVSAEDLLKELEHEGLLILSEDRDDSWLVRMGYQRYGDVLRATSLVEAAMTSSGLDVAALALELKSVDKDEQGLLEALAAVLPEKTGVEITSSKLSLDPTLAHELFINALTWRSRASVTRDVEDHVMAALYTRGLWLQVYEVFFRLSLVPDHRMNAAYWLHPFLHRSALVNRDAYLSHAVAKSFEDHGAVWSLINATLKADITRWPSESRRLAALTLAWLASASDRRVRDRSSKALARVIASEPKLGRELAREFEDCDDDYILESIALAVYSACLLTPERSAEFVPALEGLLMTTSGTPNVLVRDSVRLLAELVADTPIQARVAKLLKTYPAKAQAPTKWPTLADAKPLLDLDRLPLNMKLWGESLGPDFWRYQVESTVHDFELEKAGITYENIACWLMVETLRLGYPGHEQCALEADGFVQSQYGGGRGREGYGERLGKKYYWMLLHRLVGILADNVEPKQDSWSESKPGPGHLWSVDLRKADITDVRDIASARVYPDQLLQGPQYPFPDKAAVDIKKWVRRDDFTPHGACIVRRSQDGDEWVALSLSARDSDSPPSSEEWREGHLGVEILYTSIFVDGTAPMSARVGGDRDVFDGHGASCYRGYFGEYPSGKVFSQLMKHGSFNKGPKHMNFSEVTLMRGAEWEYDYSWTGEERAEGLRVPCQDVVSHLGLRWDRQRGWVDALGDLVAFEAGAKRRYGLFIRRSSLNKYLQATGQLLVYRRFAQRGLFDMRGRNSSQIDLFAWMKYQCDGEPDVFRTSERPFNC